jgi:hypothetical protein
MNIGIPEWLAPWLIGAGLISIVLALAYAIWAYIQLRRAEYYVVREEARRRLLRALLLAFLFVLITISFVFLPRQAPAPAATPIPTSGPVASPTPTRAAPTPTPTTTPTPKPTATEPFIPTSTPMATLPAAFTSPIPSAVPPPGDAHFEFWTLAEGVDASGQPIDPGEQFPAGIMDDCVVQEWRGDQWRDEAVGARATLGGAPRLSGIRGRLSGGELRGAGLAGRAAADSRQFCCRGESGIVKGSADRRAFPGLVRGTQSRATGA